MKDHNLILYLLKTISYCCLINAQVGQEDIHHIGEYIMLPKSSYAITFWQFSCEKVSLKVNPFTELFDQFLYLHSVY